jgi:hypothetical protein
MSHRSCHGGGMKTKKTFSSAASLIALRAGHQIIAVFGVARLVKNLDGRHELVGGTADDRAAAREWCSMFAHEIVFSGKPRHNPAIAFAA